MRVAETAIAALREKGAFAGPVEIGDQRFLVFLENLRADRHLDDEIAAVGAGAVRAFSRSAVFGLVMLLVAEIDQRIEVIRRFREHMAAAPAVASVRAAEFDEFLAPKGKAAGAAGAAFDIDFGAIEKFHKAYIAIFSGRATASARAFRNHSRKR